MKSLQQYLKTSFVQEDKPHEKEEQTIIAGTKLNWNGTILTVEKIGPSSDDRPVKFMDGMEASWENVRHLMRIVKESTFQNYFKSLTEKKTLEVKIGDCVMVNGKRAKVTKADEDSVTVDYGSGVIGKHDISKVELVNEGKSEEFYIINGNSNLCIAGPFKSAIEAHQAMKSEDFKKESKDKKYTNLVIKKGLKDKEGCLISEGSLLEFINMKRVTIGHSKPKTMKNDGDIVIIRNEDEAIDKVISMMGLSRDGKAKKVGDCFIVYDDSHKNIAFYEKESDIPKDD